MRPEDIRSREPVTLAARPREIPLTLGGSMMPYRWSINGQFYPKADPIDVQKNEPIRFVIRNPTRMSHPFHLHGHSFYVLGKPGALNLTDPVLKDTVRVPPPERPGAAVGGEQPGAMVLSLPHRMAHGDGHGPCRANQALLSGTPLPREHDGRAAPGGAGRREAGTEVSRAARNAGDCRNAGKRAGVRCGVAVAAPRVAQPSVRRGLVHGHPPGRPRRRGPGPVFRGGVCVRT